MDWLNLKTSEERDKVLQKAKTLTKSLKKKFKEGEAGEVGVGHISQIKSWRQEMKNTLSNKRKSCQSPFSLMVCRQVDEIENNKCGYSGEEKKKKRNLWPAHVPKKILGQLSNDPSLF